MRGRALIALLLLCGVAAACRESTAPRTTLRVYVLDSIDAHALPAVVSAFDGDTTVVRGAVLTLNQDGHAMRVEQLHSTYRAYPPADTTITQQLGYRIARDSITVGYFTSCRGLCAPDEVGAFTDSALTLTYDVSPRFDPVYYYQRVDTRSDPPSAPDIGP